MTAVCQDVTFCMYEWLQQFASHAPYFVIIGILLLSGFGLPLPEDIPIIIAGYLCGKGFANPWIMFPGVYFSILLADWFVFFLGRRYGHHVSRLPLLRRYLTGHRLARAEHMLHRHGGKYIFVARFMPGLRTPLYFSAGLFKIPHWKFLLIDATAVTVSVPLLFWLSYAFADHIDLVRQWAEEAQLAAAGLFILLVAAIVAWKVYGRQRVKRLIVERKARIDALRAARKKRKSSRQWAKE